MKKLTAIFCCLWCVLLLQFTLRQKQESMTAAEAFCSMGVEQAQAKLMLSGELEGFFSGMQVSDTLDSCADMLGMGEERRLLTGQKENGTVWTLEQENVPENIQGIDSEDDLKNNPENIALRILGIQNGMQVRYYLDLSVCISEDFGRVYEVKDRMERIREEYGLESMVCIQLSGSFSSQLTEKEKSRIQERFLAACDASLAAESEEGNMKSVYAFREDIAEAVSFEGRPVNLNLIFRDNGLRTRCFLGIPVVMSDD